MTKKKVAFVTDSTAYLPEELRQHPDVYIVPIVIISEGQQYEDGVDLSSEKLYDMIRSSKEVPKTSQPSVGKFLQVYEQLNEEYDHAISIHVSNKLSGTIASSTAAKDEVGMDVEVIDSLSLSYSITTLIQRGLELVDQGEDVKEIARDLRLKVTKSDNLILLGNLEQLYKGGRMSSAQFLLGNALKIKPILKINEEGELGIFERIRSEKKATNRVVALIKEVCDEKKIDKIAVMHGNAVEKANNLKGKIKELIPNVDITIGEISSSLTVHAGEGTIAVFWNTGEN